MLGKKLRLHVTEPISEPLTSFDGFAEHLESDEANFSESNKTQVATTVCVPNRSLR